MRTSRVAFRRRHHVFARRMIDIVYKIVAFLVTLGVLVVFHELGHFWVARRCGVKVLRFPSASVASSGRAASDPTAPSGRCRSMPLGGYVKMADEREGDVDPADLPRAFNRQSVWQADCHRCRRSDRQSVARGAALRRHVPRRNSGQRAILAAPPDGSAAMAAGLAAGDLVVDVNGEPVASWQDLRWRLVKSQGSDERDDRGRTSRVARRTIAAHTRAFRAQARRLGERCVRRARSQGRSWPAADRSGGAGQTGTARGTQSRRSRRCDRWCSRAFAVGRAGDERTRSPAARCCFGSSATAPPSTFR